MNLDIKNCNNIDEGTVTIHPNTLNIKYGINGTGKTTLSKAIEYSIINEGANLKTLKPFKHLSSVDPALLPDVSGLNAIQSIAIFNENYINNYVFIEDEIIKGSFEIFIKDENYVGNDEALKQITRVINDSVNENASINDLIQKLELLAKCFGNSKNSIAKSSDLFKGAGVGHNIVNVPDTLMEYSTFIQSDNNTKWLKWQMDGNIFGEQSDICPYCTSDIKPKKQKILTVKEEYDTKKVEKLNTILTTVEQLKDYLSEDIYNKIVRICKSIDGLSKSDESYLISVRNQIYLLIDHVKEIRGFGSQSISSVDTAEQSLKNLIIDLASYKVLESQKVVEDIDIINKIIESILKEIGKVKQAVARQQSHIRKTVHKHKSDINSFLASAGYHYGIDLEENKGEMKLVLKHNDLEQNSINNAKSHLSFGEKNAFALVLFMYEALKNDADIIVLDDPISSFDKNKKFAIINRLFKGKNSFQGRTVLMLTHDFDPIVDMLCNVKEQFKNYPQRAYFLENKDGILSEKEIQKEDIQTFYQIAMENMEQNPSTINKMIYLRRLYELQEDNSEAYQLLSNIFKTREIPIKKINGVVSTMTQGEIQYATDKIKEFIPEFTSYSDIYKSLSDPIYVIEQYENALSNYEKLQLYRIVDPNTDDNVLRKFVNETYHLENDYLFQLNPRRYSTIPQYIIDVCDEQIEKIRQDSLVKN